MVRSRPTQLGLFDGLASAELAQAPVELADAGADTDARWAAARATAAELARALPPWLWFGTSSWTFPGWAGLVYRGSPSERTLRERGLAEYASHPLFRSVSVDSAYYRPLSDELLARYAAQLPPGFPCVVKLWDELASPVHPRSREPNPRFLDVDEYRRVIEAPLTSQFADHTHLVLIQLPPLRRAELKAPARLAERVGRFLQAARGAFRFAVEARNHELLTPAWCDALRSGDAVPVLSYWSELPPLAAQARALAEAMSDELLVRLMLPPGKRYAQQKDLFEPFDRLVERQSVMRDDVLDLVREFARLGRRLIVLVNNKAEGSSPLTVQELAARVAALGPLPGPASQQATGAERGAGG